MELLQYNLKFQLRLMTIDKRVFRGDQVHYTAVYCIASLLKSKFICKIME